MPESVAQPPNPTSRWLQILKICAVGRRPRRTFVRALALALACYVVFGFILLPVVVAGISMEPTYHDHTVNLCNRLAYVWHEPKRGDVVTIRYAGVHEMLLKRVIGLPGETVTFVHGKVFINGAPLEEPYLKTECHWNIGPFKLDSTEYFVVGDNRTMRWRDHKFGKTERWRIVGKVIL